MIKNTKAISMVEAMNHIKGSKDEGKEIKGFIRKFTKLKPADGKKMREKLESLGIIQIDEKYISKIIEVLPENMEELNKVFVGISLSEEEAKKVIDIVKEFK